MIASAARAHRTDPPPPFAARRSSFLLIGAVAATFLSGCSLFRSSPPTEPTAVTGSSSGADSAAARKPAAPAQRKPAPTTGSAAVADTTKPAATTSPAPEPAGGPTISVRMTPEETAERKKFFSAEALRATRALEAIRNKPLTQLQQEQMASADRFLAEARSALDQDLYRACTLAEKARIIAEELEKKVR